MVNTNIHKLSGHLLMTVLGLGRIQTSHPVVRSAVGGSASLSLTQLLKFPRWATASSSGNLSLSYAAPNFPGESTSKNGFHKEKPQQLLQPMTLADDQQVTLQQLKSDYRQILINYFSEDKKLKQKIDQFINTVFCANIPVPQLIQIHMELIDEFAKKLKLEGRSDEVLLDYRLTLIDILAHLCEVYRSSIPR